MLAYTTLCDEVDTMDSNVKHAARRNAQHENIYKWLDTHQYVFTSGQSATLERYHLIFPCEFGICSDNQNVEESPI